MNAPPPSDDTREGERVAPLSRQPRHYDPDRRAHRVTPGERAFGIVERFAWLLVLALLICTVGLALQFSPWGIFAWRAWLLPTAGGHLNTIDHLTLDRYRQNTRPLLVRQAVDSASANLTAALAPAPDSLEGTTLALDALRQAHDNERATRLLDLAQARFGPSADFDTRRVHLLIDADQLQEARTLAFDALRRHGPGDPLLDALDATFHHDHRFEGARALTLQVGHDFDALEADERSGLQLDAERPGAEPAVFAPRTRDLPLNHIAPVAAFRLAELLDTRLDLAAARPARIELAVVDRASRLKDGTPPPWRLRLQTDTDRDAEWLTGAWFRLPTEPRRFPAEHLPLWKPWLTPGAPLSTEPGSALLALEALRNHRPRHVQLERLQDLVGTHSTAWLAGQVSDVLVLSYLLNNPLYRRRGAELVQLTTLGLHIDDFGESLKEDLRPDLAAMLPELQRLRPQTLRALRVLDRRRVDPWLFPDLATSPEQQRASDAFWSRHHSLLQHLDSLERTHGDAILIAAGP